MREFLLGQMTSGDQELLENRLVADDVSYEEFLAAETELVDDFVGGRLTDDEEVRFRRLFLNDPERNNRIRFAAALRKVAARAEANHESNAALRSRTPQTPVKRRFISIPQLGWILAGSLPLVFLATVWLSLTYLAQPTLIEPVSGQRRIEGQIARVRLSDLRALVVVRVPIRDSEGETLTATLKLFDDELPVVTFYGLQRFPVSDRYFIDLPIAAHLLSTGDYSIDVETERSAPVAGTFYFRVVE